MKTLAVVTRLAGDGPSEPQTRPAHAGRRGLSLTQQFALVGSIVLVFGMAAVGIWVAQKIRVGVIQNAGAATGLYVESVLAPSLQSLAGRDTLSKSAQDRLDRLFANTKLGQETALIKVWTEGGLIAYSTDANQIGRRYPVSDSLERAWRGVVTAEYDDLAHEENALDRHANMPLLEMYLPLRELDSSRIIGVVELYFRADNLEADLASATRESWLVVGGTALAMLAALFGIVVRGNRTIEAQRRSLETQIVELGSLAEQNAALRQRVQRAYRRKVELNERFLKRVGADLHDGPAQHLGLALLHLDSIGRTMDASSAAASRDGQTMETVRTALQHSLSEIRAISSGLTAPELETADVNAALRLAIAAHRERTSVEAEADLQPISNAVPTDFKICCYRFVQEALNNAFKHARASRVRVRARAGPQGVEIEVRDNGRGFDAGAYQGQATGIGLVALRDRVETLGGWFEVRSASGRGTILTVRFTQQAMDEFNE